MNNFPQCFKWLLQDEGGYTNDPNDSGGATNLGITIGDYRKYIKADATPSDVKTLTVAQAQGIYKTKYWDAVGGDKLPSGVDNACFNYGVLAGIGRPIADLKKFADIKDPNKLIDAICDEMKAFLIRLAETRPKDKKFEKGWVARVDRLRTRSHSLTKTKDIVSAPVATAAAGVGMYATFTNYIHMHPYISGMAAIAGAALIGYVVHIIRNKK